jgi:hypothetical protein
MSKRIPSWTATCPDFTREKAMSRPKDIGRTTRRFYQVKSSMEEYAT